MLEHMIGWLKNHRKKLLIRGGIVCAIFALAYVAVGWYLSSQLIKLGIQKVEYNHAIVSRQGDDFVISGSAYDVDGVMGGQWLDGRGKAIFDKPVNIVEPQKTSQRRLIDGASEGLLPESKLALMGNVWDGDPKTSLGINFESVQYQTELGEVTSWYIPAAVESDKWVIGVHGIGAPKAEFLRFVRPLHQSGYNFLIIDYRGDATAPKHKDGYTRLGHTEWRDLESAVDYAQGKNAKEINLFGISMGGSVVQNFLRNSELAKGDQINKVVLDSPALDWDHIIEFRIKQKGFPGFLKYPGKDLSTIRAGINFRNLSTVDKPESIRHQTLIFHNKTDRSVPQDASVTLANARPDKVKLIDVGGGAHARSWNYDQVRYEKELTQFLGIHIF